MAKNAIEKEWSNAQVTGTPEPGFTKNFIVKVGDKVVFNRKAENKEYFKENNIGDLVALIKANA